MINPIYVLILLILLSGGVFYKKELNKKTLEKKYEELLQFRAKAEAIDELKKRWNKNEIEKRVEKIARMYFIKKFVTLKKKRGFLILEGKKLPKNEGDRFIKMVFNSMIPIREFQIKRLDNNSLYFYAEIEL